MTHEHQHVVSEPHHGVLWVTMAGQLAAPCDLHQRTPLCGTISALVGSIGKQRQDMSMAMAMPTRCPSRRTAQRDSCSTREARSAAFHLPRSAPRPKVSTSERRHAAISQYWLAMVRVGVCSQAVLEHHAQLTLHHKGT